MPSRVQFRRSGGLTTNLIVRDFDVICLQECRRPLAVDATCVVFFARGRHTHDGAVLVKARRRMERMYFEFLLPSSRASLRFWRCGDWWAVVVLKRCHLFVLGES